MQQAVDCDSILADFLNVTIVDLGGGSRLDAVLPINSLITESLRILLLFFEYILM